MFDWPEMQCENRAVLLLHLLAGEFNDVVIRHCHHIGADYLDRGAAGRYTWVFY